MKIFTQSATILLSYLFVLAVTQTALSSYMTLILAGIILLSIIFIFLSRRSKTSDDLFVGSNKEVATVVIAIMLAIFLTGGLDSGLYFLLYFLLFGIAFLFEPPIVFVMLVGMLTVFFGEATVGNLLPNIVKLGSLVFLSPVAYFFGREFAKKNELRDEVNDTTGQILEDAATIKEENPKMSDDEKDELDDIIEKTQELRQKVQEDN